MKLPGETGVEFVEILPFTPANRNNLIGWIAGRSDDDDAFLAIEWAGRGLIVNGQSASHHNVNRAKRSMVIDLKRPEGLLEGFILSTCNRVEVAVTAADDSEAERVR